MTAAESPSPGTNETLPSGITARYRILRELGKGGMGSVYLAEDTQLPRKVAIKTIRAEWVKNDEIRKRIERECNLHARIGSHPHIVTLYDKIEGEGRIALVMEFVDGVELQKLLEQSARSGHPLPWRDGVAIATQVLDALSRIHFHDIVHRDIKPSNILVGRNDDGSYCAKLMDFGIARLQDDDEMTALTREGGSGPGTPIYMAPEQIDPRTFGALSAATDMYAMGVMLYQIFAGRPPFSGSLTEIFNGHLNGAPPPLDVTRTGNLPPALVEVLLKALAKHPHDRFQTAGQFRAHLMEIAEPGRITPINPVASTQVNGLDVNRTMPSGTGGATFAGFDGGAVSGQTVGVGGAHRAQRTRDSLLFGGLVAVGLLAITGLGALAYTALNSGQDASAEAPKEQTPVAEAPAAAAPAIVPDTAVPPAADEPTPPPLVPAGTAAPSVPAPDTAIPADAAIPAAAVPPLVPADTAPMPSDPAAAVPPGSPQGGSAAEELRKLREAQGTATAPPPADPDTSVTTASDPGFSAADELRKMREQSGAATTTAPPDPVPAAAAAAPAPAPSAPKPAAKKPASKPASKPPAKPVEAKSAPKADPPAPPDDGGFKINVKSVTDRKVNK